ncbi:probable inactive histone-lysine N-methyltransferase SUVR2 isoform X2 [Phalaenopsis equestris]|uniref:probable inactive histone-lysine N-methyltransferase SUVR2 isoform X2 n=1 Tax=Phalaenopsis equestris TaxID=78828 RepID=UPI0009E4F1F1|nr:probable inactive histone-lysine N-methyltransferase SUVR2 isoform X2 [Phalaenopsis equestris]
MAPSAQLQRAIAALKAMKRLGFDQGVSKAILKELLKVYGNNWEYIEDENYRLLADAILDSLEAKDNGANKKYPAVADELGKPVKRLTAVDDLGPSQSTPEHETYGETFLKKKKLVASGEASLISFKGEKDKPVEAQCSHGGIGAFLSPDSLPKDETAGIGEMHPQLAINFEEPRIPLDHTTSKITRRTMRSSYQRDEQYMCDREDNVVGYKEPKIEPDIGVLQETAVITTILDKPIHVTGNDISTNCNISTAVVEPDRVPSEIAANGEEARNLGDSGANTLNGPTHAFNIQLATNKGNDVQNELSINVNIVSSNMGKEDVAKLSPLNESMGSCKTPVIHRSLTGRSFNGSPNLVSLEAKRGMNGLQSGLHIDGESNGLQENGVSESSNNNVSHCLAFLPLHENVVIAFSPQHDKHDIAKGEEKLKISAVNEFNSEETPPYFRYISCNAVYQNAHVNFSLAQISEDDSCINCFGNCLSASIPCACTRVTGGEFVYTLDGLLKTEFLTEFIYMNCYMGKHFLCCKNCPIGMFSSGYKPVACKGHPVRKFIKECWSKCGCNKQCGNRVVQRGITRNLQVFYTANGKGWGLRTLEELPRGAFVYEYVGEILTRKEFCDRTVQGYGSAEHTYTLVLDADWGSVEGLRDEEALCLDATFYGNVGRFVNHRCFDANLVEVPVEWETPDHNYYHLAYFTARKVEAFEELTWDYGIDFKDLEHPIKTFKCLCGSRYCRDCCRSKGRKRK